jgi:DNA-binding phage protein
MATARPNCPDDATAHKKVLETIERFQKLATGMKQYVEATKNRLLYETDHPAILAAARQVITSRRGYARDAAVHGPNHAEQSIIAKADPKLPAVLRHLRAARLLVTDEQAFIEFGGGFHHFGLLAFRLGATNTPSGDRGRTKLIDGLWFYEDTN